MFPKQYLTLALSCSSGTTASGAVGTSQHFPWATDSNPEAISPVRLTGGSGSWNPYTSTDWAAIVDASPLRLGQTYKLCLDLDGEESSAKSPGDVGVNVTVTPFEKIRPPAAIPAGQEAKRFEILCKHASNGCSMNAR